MQHFFKTYSIFSFPRTCLELTVCLLFSLPFSSPIRAESDSFSTRSLMIITLSEVRFELVLHSSGVLLRRSLQQQGALRHQRFVQRSAAQGHHDDHRQIVDLPLLPSRSASGAIVLIVASERERESGGGVERVCFDFPGTAIVDDADRRQF